MDVSKFKGHIIDFEGLDCSFKETNANAFYERLKSEFARIGIGEMKYKKKNEKTATVFDTVQKESFPRYDNSSSILLNKWLQSKYNRKSLDNKSINCLYGVDRFDYWNEILKAPEINRLSLHKTGRFCFVFDRYSISNAYYNPTDGYNTRLDDVTFDRDIFGSPLPTIVVIMDMKYETIVSQLSAKKNKDKNETDYSYLKRVYDNMHFMIRNDILGTVGIKSIVVKCEDRNGIRTREDLADEIWYRALSYVVEI